MADIRAFARAGTKRRSQPAPGARGGIALALLVLAVACSAGTGKADGPGASATQDSRQTSRPNPRAKFSSNAARTSATVAPRNHAGAKATPGRTACVDPSFDPGPIPPKRREQTSSTIGPTYRSEGTASLESGGKTTSTTLPTTFFSSSSNDYYSEDIRYEIVGQPPGYPFSIQTTHDGSAITSISDTHPTGSQGFTSYNFPLLHPVGWMGGRTATGETPDRRMKLLLTHASPGHWDFLFTYVGCHPPTDANAKTMRIDITTDRDTLPNAWRAWTLDVDLITGVNHFRKHVTFTAE